MISNKIIKCKLCNKYKNHKSKSYCNACYQQLRYERIKKTIPLKKCECSEKCEIMIYSTNTNGKPLRYAEGHENRGRKPHNFKGYKIDRDGYILSHVSGYHPFKTRDKYVRTHRLVYENYLYIMFDEHIYIPKEIDIHHINGNVQDNSLINLEPLQHDEHGSISNIGRVFPILDTSKRRCNLCGGKTRLKSYGGADWRIDINGYLCIDCHIMIKYHRRKFGLPTSGY